LEFVHTKSIKHDSIILNGKNTGQIKIYFDYEVNGLKQNIMFGIRFPTHFLPAKAVFITTRNALDFVGIVHC
jgi:hypothetical protein